MAKESTNGAIGKSQDDIALLESVKAHLADAQPQKALEFIRKARSSSPWAVNAMGVCQLRLGDVVGAMNSFRGLVLEPGGFSMRSDAPTAFKANFAAAMFLNDNLPGCLSTLAEIGNDEHPAVAQLREAFTQWKCSLTIWERIQYYMGGQPSRRPVFATPPGSLE